VQADWIDVLGLVGCTAAGYYARGIAGAFIGALIVLLFFAATHVFLVKPTRKVEQIQEEHLTEKLIDEGEDE